MDLKFTFAKSTPPAVDNQAGKAANLTGSGATQLPLNSASRNLFVEVTESAEAAKAVAVSGDGVNYGSSPNRCLKRCGAAIWMPKPSSNATV